MKIVNLSIIELNPFMTEIPITQKPLYFFALQYMIWTFVKKLKTPPEIVNQGGF